MELWLVVWGREKPALSTVNCLGKARTRIVTNDSRNVSTLRLYQVLPMCVERDARAGARHSKGESWLVVGKVVGWRVILIEEVFPLLVVIVSEHVESLLNHFIIRIQLLVVVA